MDQEQNQGQEMNNPYEEDGGFKLRHTVWVIIVLVIGVLLWFFLFNDGFKTLRSLIDTRSDVEILEDDPSIENITRIYNAENLPIPNDAIVTSGGATTEGETIFNATFGYTSQMSKEELRELYLDWASSNGYEVSNPTEDTFVVNVSFGEKIVISVDEFGGRGEVVITFR